VSFASPVYLLALVLVPVAVLLYLGEERRRRGQLAAFTSPLTAPSVVRSSPGWRRHVPIIIFLLALALLALGLARPRATVTVDTERAAVVLVTDRSGSMEATDVLPSRLIAARRAANSLLDRVPARLRVGAVMFNQRAEVLEPLTTDRAAVRAALDSVTAAGGTATGEALASALSLVRPGGKGTTPAAIVLLSDGVSVKGRSPIAVAREARRLKVKVHTIALGTAAGTIRVPRPDGAGVEVRRVPPDPTAMREIARITGGETFSATNAARVEAAFRKLGSSVGRKRENREITAVVAGAALVLILLGAGLSLRWTGRLT
jgi:Ca-activated chloride channel family protein